jgi:hypothetical protein
LTWLYSILFILHRRRCDAWFCDSCQSYRPLAVSMAFDFVIVSAFLLKVYFGGN